MVVIVYDLSICFSEVAMSSDGSGFYSLQSVYRVLNFDGPTGAGAVVDKCFSKLVHSFLITV